LPFSAALGTGTTFGRIITTPTASTTGAETGNVAFQAVNSDPLATSVVIDGTGINVTGTYKSGGTAGMSCRAGTVNTATMVVTNGIVTHC
jgi:hypothetical protein